MNTEITEILDALKRAYETAHQRARDTTDSLDKTDQERICFLLSRAISNAREVDAIHRQFHRMRRRSNEHDA